MASKFKEGDLVTLWTRPKDNLILVFGHGTYGGEYNVGGKQCPVILFKNGTEVVLHYNNVWCGHKAEVLTTIQKHAKTVTAVNWSLDKFLQGELPAVDELPVAEPIDGVRPRTATDALMQLKQSIQIETKKIEMYKKGIADAETVIAAKRKEMATIKQSVLKELEGIEDETVDSGDVAEREIQVAPAIAADVFVAAANRAAEED